MTQQPVPGPTISVCRKLDVACAMPVSTQIVDASKGATFTIETGFVGYLQATVDGYLPSLYFFNPPVDHDQTIAMIPVATESEYTILMSTLGLSPSSARGTVVLQAVDCTGKFAAGVSYSSPNGDSQSKSFYYTDGLPSSLATATDAWGFGGMANLAAGTVSVKAHLASPAADLSPISLIVRPMSMSFSQVVPSAE